VDLPAEMEAGGRDSDRSEEDTSSLKLSIARLVPDPGKWRRTPLYDLQQHLASSFPMREKYTDCRGAERIFEITVRTLPIGFVIEARECSDSLYGYEFSHGAEANPFEALGAVRRKIRKALSRTNRNFAIGRLGRSR
jgi:hypothetical protein